MPKFLKLPRWNDVLVEIFKNKEKNRYCDKLNKKIQGSRTHIREIVKLLARKRLIDIKPMKKIKLLRLTDKGKKITDSLIQIRTELGCL